MSIDILSLLETRAPSDAGLAAEIGRGLSALEASARRRRAGAVDRIAAATGARSIRLGGQRVLMLSRHHSFDELAALLSPALAPQIAAHSPALPELLARYTRRDEFLGAPGRRLLFLDTETTGLSHGAGTFAFLVGFTILEEGGVRSHRLFIPEPADEPLAMRIVQGFLRRYPFLVSFNGKSYDMHILKSRLVINDPLAALDRDPLLLPHLDLLHLCRRFWRHRMERVGLQDVEAEILGLHRAGDVAGSLIPAIYFDFLHRGETEALEGVLRHNLQDLLSMVLILQEIIGRVLEPVDPGAMDPGEVVAIARLYFEKQMFDACIERVLALGMAPAGGPVEDGWRALVYRVLKRRVIPKARRREVAASLADAFEGDAEFQRLRGRL